MSEHRADRLSTDGQTLLASGPEATLNHLSVGYWEPRLDSCNVGWRTLLLS